MVRGKGRGEENYPGVYSKVRFNLDSINEGLQMMRQVSSATAMLNFVILYPKLLYILYTNRRDSNSATHRHSRLWRAATALGISVSLLLIGTEMFMEPTKPLQAEPKLESTVQLRGLQKYDQ